MATFSAGSFEIRTLFDGRTLTMNLDYNFDTQYKSESNSSADPTFAPNAATTPFQIKPLVFVNGQSGINQVNKRSNWFIDGNALQGAQGATNIATYGVSFDDTPGVWGIKIAKNLTKANLIIRCEYEYMDGGGVSTNVVNSLTIYQDQVPSSIIMARGEYISGNTFQSIGAGANPSLQLKAVMVRNGEDDTSSVAYQWQNYNGSAWVNAADAANLHTGSKTNTLTIYANAINNIGYYRCRVTDIDSGSSTNNHTVNTDFTLYDRTDDIVVAADLSTTGVNVTTNTNVTFSIWQGKSEWSIATYNGITISFYRLVPPANNTKDATFTPVAGDFNGWDVTEANTIKRKFGASDATIANRTVVLKQSHQRADAPISKWAIRVEK